ncbi:HipA N-terminal domain-containing protein [Dyella sp. KRB-257]|uniref:HipA N-terminal domain-containing protein n=1 Tax=Dyella sp. KRB-257 TaxID=3400915 RepID=UPI003C0AFFC2
MTKPRLLACLNGTPMGTVERDRAGRLRFAYDDAWRRRPDAIALSLSMPLIRSEHPHAAIDAFLWGLLPDNEQTLARDMRAGGLDHPILDTLPDLFGDSAAEKARQLRGT